MSWRIALSVAWLGLKSSRALCVYITTMRKVVANLAMPPYGTIPGGKVKSGVSPGCGATVPPAPGGVVLETPIVFVEP